MTNFLKKSELQNNWYEIDASNAVVGRLATIYQKYLEEKTKQILHHIWIMVTSS